MMEELVGDYILVIMTRDHKQIDNIFEDFIKTKKLDFNKSQELFSDFISRLKRHMMWEEQILFPMLENQKVVYTDLMAFIRMDHRKLKDLVDKINEKLKKTEDSNKLQKEFMKLMDEHEKREKEMFYPLIERSTTEKERKEAIKRMSSLPSIEYLEFLEKSGTKE